MGPKELQPKKSFWERPEGTPGMIILAGLIVGGGILLYKALPTIIELMTNIYYAIGLGLGLFIILYMLADPKVRLLIGHLYKSGVRAATQLFIELNPVGIIKGYVQDLKVKRRNMNDQITKLKAEIGKLAEQMAKEKKSFESKMATADVAKRQVEKGNSKYKNQMTLNLRSAGRAKEAYKNFEVLKAKMDKMYAVLNKMYDYAGVMVEDLEDEVKYIEMKRNAILASHSVMKSAQSIIAGNDDERMLFDQAMEHMVDDIGEKIGEMDRFMDVSRDFMDGVDLENMVFEEEGLAMLEEWESGDHMLFLEEGNTNYIKDINASKEVPIQIEATTTTTTNANGTASNSAKSKYF